MIISLVLGGFDEGAQKSQQGGDDTEDNAYPVCTSKGTDEYQIPNEQIARLINFIIDLL